MKKIYFQWDDGNKHKSVIKHGISNHEAESVFYDPENVISLDIKHSITEKRYICIGESYLNRILISIFTVRNGEIRVISTRIANKKIKHEYLSNRQ